jgi:hypothetical protein
VRDRTSMVVFGSEMSSAQWDVLGCRFNRFVSRLCFVLRPQRRCGLAWMLLDSRYLALAVH